MKAVIYCRVSTPGQAEEGVSMDAQEAKARAWAKLNDAEDILGPFADAGYSGKRADNRPALQQALDVACEHGAALVVYSLSRLARNTRETLEIADRLNKSDAHLVSVTEQIDTTGACGKMIFRLLAVFAEFERDLVSERTKAIMQHLKANGRRVGQVPYGFKAGPEGRLEEVEEQQQVLVMIRHLHSLGTNYSQIARELNEQGIPAKSGGVWYPKVVRDILLRECPATPSSSTRSASRSGNRSG